MTNYPNGVDPQTCCPTMPTCSRDEMSRTVASTCQAQCPPSKDKTVDKCCMFKCKFSQLGLTNSDGTFNPTTAIDILTNSTTNPTTWKPLIQSIVNGCATNGKRFNFLLFLF